MFLGILLHELFTPRRIINEDEGLWAVWGMGGGSGSGVCVSALGGQGACLWQWACALLLVT